MTCIVGLVHEGTVYIGGDSAGVSGYDFDLRADEKVFTNGPFVMGFTSSFRMGNLLRYSLDPPRRYPDIDVMRYMATTFIDEVRSTLSAGGVMSRSNGQEFGGVFLVGYAGRLFCVDVDYQVGESRSNYMAIGCGAQAAMGALYATRSFHPLERVQVALAAAESCNAGVRGPFVIEKSM